MAAVNAGVSVLQARNIYQPFALITPGSRDATGAFVGNLGSLALALALAAVSCLGHSPLERPDGTARCGRAGRRVSSWAAFSSTAT